MEKQTNDLFGAEERAKLILSLFSTDHDDEDEDEEDDNSGCISALLEAISIIFEKCDTKEECIEAINRLQAAMKG